MAPHNKDGPAMDQALADKNEQAIDEEDSDVDDDFAQLQRIQSAKRREDKQQKSRIQELLDPFPFAPNIRPLGISDLQSAIALENAAFTDPQHRASAEKVWSHSRTQEREKKETQRERVSLAGFGSCLGLLVSDKSRRLSTD